MYYEINVTLNGNHFFATSDRSIQDWNTLKRVFNTFAEKFPTSEGFELYITRVEYVGSRIEPSDLTKI